MLKLSEAATHFLVIILNPRSIEHPPVRCVVTGCNIVASTAAGHGRGHHRRPPIYLRYFGDTVDGKPGVKSLDSVIVVVRERVFGVAVVSCTARSPDPAPRTVHVPAIRRR